MYGRYLTKLVVCNTWKPENIKILLIQCWIPTNQYQYLYLQIPLILVLGTWSISKIWNIDKIPSSLGEIPSKKADYLTFNIWSLKMY